MPSSQFHRCSNKLQNIKPNELTPMYPARLFLNLSVIVVGLALIVAGAVLISDRGCPLEQSCSVPVVGIILFPIGIVTIISYFIYIQFFIRIGQGKGDTDHRNDLEVIRMNEMAARIP
jgi:hypothetical protein